MPRRARIRVAGLPVHVTQRGHGKGPCFFVEGDYLNYLDLLERHALRERCAVHAFVLMTNHVHLLVTPETGDGVSRMMKSVAQLHAQFINWRHEREGSLWGDRFHSSVVQCDRYFLAASRYIEGNPVRAQMVGAPEQYRWSSYGSNALGRESRLITPHPVYQDLGGDAPARLHAYRRLTREGLDEDLLEAIRYATNRCLPLGDDNYVACFTGRSTPVRRRGRPRKGQ